MTDQDKDMNDRTIDIEDGLLDVLEKYRNCGEIIHPDGTRSIGKIPEKEKWFLFHLFKGLELEEIREIEASIDRAFPESLKRFYNTFNGVLLYGAGQVSIWGLRKKTRSDMPNYQPIPFVISHLDEAKEIFNSPDGAIYFGEYFGVFRFYAKEGLEEISVCKVPDATPIEVWDNVNVMIVDVATRLSRWFDENAQPIGSQVKKYPVLFEG